MTGPFTLEVSPLHVRGHCSSDSKALLEESRPTKGLGLITATNTGLQGIAYPGSWEEVLVDRAEVPGFNVHNLLSLLVRCLKEERVLGYMENGGLESWGDWKCSFLFPWLDFDLL